MVNKNHIRSIVSRSIENHMTGDTVSKSELTEILTDILCDFAKDKELSDAVAGNISQKEKIQQKVKGIR
ncbi:MAG: hypothetical protein LIO86_14825 [Lachnospiraceae bacterium]|nr:hypothetical protein [Lachnospiraceae bacterium]